MFKIQICHVNSHQSLKFLKSQLIFRIDAPTKIPEISGGRRRAQRPNFRHGRRHVRRVRPSDIWRHLRGEIDLGRHPFGRRGHRQQTSPVLHRRVQKEVQDRHWEQQEGAAQVADCVRKVVRNYGITTYNLSSIRRIKNALFH